MALRNVLGRTAQRIGLGPAARGAKRVYSIVRGRVIQQRRARAYSALRRSSTRLQVISGTPTKTALPVVMCLWRRPDRLNDVLRLLANQDVGTPLRLILWNNDKRLDNFYRTIISDAELGIVESVELYSSATNVGGIGRFLSMRWLVSEGYRGPFVMIDDDEDVSPHFISDLMAAYRPYSIAGWWAFSYELTYYQRAELRAGQQATYVGTGGAVCDSVLVTSDLFFNTLPPRYLFLEDIWMSTFASWNQWNLTKVETPVEFVARDEDQHHAIFDLKTEFSELLRSAQPIIDPTISPSGSPTSGA